MEILEDTIELDGDMTKFFAATTSIVRYAFITHESMTRCPEMMMAPSLDEMTQGC